MLRVTRATVLLCLDFGIESFDDIISWTVVCFIYGVCVSVYHGPCPCRPCLFHIQVPASAFFIDRVRAGSVCRCCCLVIFLYFACGCVLVPVGLRVEACVRRHVAHLGMGTAVRSPLDASMLILVRTLSVQEFQARSGFSPCARSCRPSRRSPRRSARTPRPPGPA